MPGKLSAEPGAAERETIPDAMPKRKTGAQKEAGINTNTQAPETEWLNILQLFSFSIIT